MTESESIEEEGDEVPENDQVENLEIDIPALPIVDSSIEEKMRRLEVE